MGVTLTSPRPTHGALNWDTATEADFAGIAGALNTAQALTTGTDLNTLAQSGAYVGSSLTNAPLSSTGQLLVQAFYIDANTQVQTAFGLTGTVAGIQYSRTRVSGTWGTWRQTVVDTGWSLTPIVLATGWSTLTDSNGGTTAGGVRVVNGQLEYRFKVTRSGAALTASSGGAFTSSPVAVATVAPATYPQFVPASVLPDHFYGTNKSGAARIDASGNIGLMDTYPADTIGTGDVIQITLRGLQG